MSWLDIETAPKTGERILVKDDKDDEPYITAWIDEVYTAQGGSGGPAGWFSGDYSDSWGDRPVFNKPTLWMPLPK